MVQDHFMIENNAVSVDYYGDGHAAHFVLSGERFQHSQELLKLMVRYEGACADDPKRYATAYPCSYNCTECERSIYSIIKIKEKFFTQKCTELIHREPRIRDEWEVSLVSFKDTPDHPRYENYFFRAEAPIDNRTIIEIIYDMMKKYYPDAVKRVKYCYIKVRRFDIEKAIDASVVANADLMLTMKEQLIADEEAKFEIPD